MENLLLIEHTVAVQGWLHRQLDISEQSTAPQMYYSVCGVELGK